jgi:hypothetical protein
MGANMEADHDEQETRDHAREENNVRRFGTICLIAGILLIPLTYLAFMSVEVVTANDAADSDDLVFAFLGILTLALGGTALIILGGMERLHRPVRKRQRYNSTAVNDLRVLIGASAEDSYDRFDVWLGIAAAIPGRLEAIEEALAAVAETLPDALLSEHWRGYAASERNQAGLSTGTDGAGRRPPYIGLVPDDSSDQ